MPYRSHPEFALDKTFASQVHGKGSASMGSAADSKG
jgi:hypothetical protein